MFSFSSSGLTKKVCALCGIVQSKQWSRHWTDYHPFADPQKAQLPLGTEPLEGWWCNNGEEIMFAQLANKPFPKPDIKRKTWKTQKFDAKSQVGRQNPPLKRISQQILCASEHQQRAETYSFNENNQFLPEQRLKKRIEKQNFKINKQIIEEEQANLSMTYSDESSHIQIKKTDNTSNTANRDSVRDIREDIRRHHANEYEFNYHSLFTQLSEKYTKDNIMKALTGCSDVERQFQKLLEQSVKNSAVLVIQPIKLIISYAIKQGGSYFVYLPKMINETNSDHKDELVKHLFLESKMYHGSLAADWLRVNYEHVNEDSYNILKELDNDFNFTNNTEALFISLIVRCDPNEFQSLCNTTQLVVKYPNLYRILKYKATNLNQQPRIPYKQFVLVMTAFCTDIANDKLVQNNEQEFKDAWIPSWIKILERIQSSSHVDDAYSVEQVIKMFNKKYTEQVNTVDERETYPLINACMKEQLHEANNTQTAIAQISFFLSTKYEQQIHIIKGGQGKSRIATVIASMALESKAFQKVHMVYSSRVLQKKDEDDFRAFWKHLGYDQQVDYHHDLNFKVEQNDLLVFDEADEYFYNNTDEFVSFVAHHLTICLTATTGGSKNDQTEKNILNNIGMKIFDHNKDSDGNDDLPFQDITLDTDQAILDFLNKKKLDMPVLVYCNDNTKKFLIEEQNDFTDLDVCDVDHLLLRNLDKKQQDYYRILLTSDSQKMRGIDYRSRTVGMVLLVTKSFEHRRQANQAGYRVGRQQDKCERYILDKVDLIDVDCELIYKQKLIKYLRQNIPMPVRTFAIKNPAKPKAPQRYSRQVKNQPQIYPKITSMFTQAHTSTMANSEPHCPTYLPKPNPLTLNHKSFGHPSTTPLRKDNLEKSKQQGQSSAKVLKHVAINTNKNIRQ